ncbi:MULTISPECIES: glycosyltransferase family 2 protein [Haloferax]|uniref:Glycosyltransferase n=2 Tax=Haloferax TaxID=2251 RepID=A0A6G1Z6W7_9EURY|nr:MULTISPECIES: glycosyltransferase family A protein [Haloferax]KAB1185119.1 glycosyltransferase [Haloferax sp. CBA1149]MRW82296.1 glycosyltransferase [Haloferax marinisediminis]
MTTTQELDSNDQLGRGDDVPSEEPDLSVVVVTYNEAERIEGCLESVFESCRKVGPFEVILVDSNSTDRTVAIAEQFPITLLKLTDDEYTTPSAGRYVGTKYARGDTILYVDGDMHLERGWVSEAYTFLKDNQEVVGVDGQLNERGRARTPQRVDAIRGVALYDKAAVTKVGGFDPFQKSLEDIDLGFRLTLDGGVLYRLPSVAAMHPIAKGASEIRRRWRSGYIEGVGQTLRKSAPQPRLLAMHLLRIRYKILIGSWFTFGLLSVAFSPLVTAGWALTTMLFFAFLATQRGSAEAFRLTFGYALLCLGFLYGVRIPPQPPEEFPLSRVEVVKRVSVLQ